MSRWRLSSAMKRTNHPRTWSVLALVNAMVASMGLAVLVTGLAAAPAQAAGSPNLSIAVSAPASPLIDSPATPLTYSATVTNATATNGYNLGYRVVLPPNVTFVSSTAGEPTLVVNGPGASTTLFFENVADILKSSTHAFSIDVTAPNGSYPVNANVAVTIDAYANSDPRTAPTMAGDRSVSGSTGSATGTATAKITAIKITKSEPSPENELVRGIHDHVTTYTLKVTTNGRANNNAVVVEDYLPAGLEFLGCGAWDNTTNAPTYAGNTIEYPGAARLTATTDLPMASTAALATVAATSTGCLVPNTVETLVVDPDGAGPLASGVYTHVVWNVGTMATDSVLNLTYAAGVPMRANTTSWSGTTPATACSAGNCGQAANLDNNSGPETTDELQLTNGASAAGTYTSTVAPTTSTSVRDASTLTVTAENLALQKSVNPTVVTRGGISTWTLALQTGEYRSVGTDLVITDTLPDGLCPLGSANYTTSPTAQDAECAPVAGRNPTISVDGGAATPLAYNGNPVEQSDGSWRFSFAITAGMAASSTLAITFSTMTREYFQEGFANAAPVLANDPWTNTVAATSTSSGVIAGTNVAGTPTAAPDDSSAGQSSANPALTKLVAVPVPNGVLSCDSAVYQEADTMATAVTYYRPNDRVCYRIRLTLDDQLAADPVGSALYFSNVDVTDFLPPGFAFERYWGASPVGETGNDQITTVTADAPVAGPAGVQLAWHLGSGSPTRYVDASTQKVFEVEFSAIAPAPGAVGGGTILSSANLSKATTVNTAGVATSMRNQATSLVTRPSLGIDKSRVPASNPVAPGSVVDYSLAVKNNAPLPDPQGFAGASNITIRDLLPFELRCSAVSAISNGGTCTNPSPDVAGARSQINWTVAGPLLPQATQNLTYKVTLPTDLAPSEDLTNNAGVRTYDGPVNTGGAPTTYIPAGNIDPTLTSNIPETASDAETVVLTPTSVVKLQQSELSESGNTKNASPAATADQATIGEYVDYTIQATIPANAMVYDGTFTDPLPAGMTLLTTGPNAVIPTAYLNGAALPGTWSFDAGSLKVTLATPYQVDAIQDVIEVRFRTVVTDTAANAAGQNKVNTATFTHETKAASIGVEPWQVVTNTGSTTLGIVEPALSMSKADNDADKLVAPGQLVTYTLVARNTGSAAHEVVLTDCVPQHLTVQPATLVAPAGGTVTSSTTDLTCIGTLITWTYPSSFSLAQGATTTVTYGVIVDAPTTAGQTFTNTAKTVASSYPGNTNPDERKTYQATATDTLATVAPTLTKSVTPTDATVGSTLTYTVTVTLPGGLVAPDTTVMDVVPAGIDVESLTGVTCTNPPAGFTCPTVGAVPMLPAGGPNPATGGNLLYFLNDLPASPAGTPWTITLTYTATPINDAAVIAGATRTNTADMRWNATDTYGPGNLPDPTNPIFTLNTADAQATVTIHEPKIVTDKDVTYTSPTNAPCDQVHDATNGATDADACQISPDAAGTMTYTITVQNTGDWPAYDVQILDSADLPAPSQIASLAITGNGGTTEVDTDITDGDGLEFAYPGPLAAGASLTITYTVTLTPSASNHEGDQVVNTVTVPSFYAVSGPDRAADPGRAYRTYVGGTDTDTVTIRYPKPSIAKAPVSDGSDARIGQPFTYSVTVSNATSAAALKGADITDTLPTGWTYVPGSATVIASTGTTPASVVLGDPAIVGQTLTWTNVADLAPLGNITFTYQVIPGASLATPATTGTFAHVNSATVSGDDNSGAAGNADGPYSATTTAQAFIRQVDLELTKAIITPAPYGYGQTVQYAVTVTNKGPDAATGVTVEELLPAGLLYRSNVASTGTYNAGTGIWTIGALASGATQTLTLTVQINAIGPVVNDAQVKSADQYDIDSAPDNLVGAPAQDDEARVSIVTSPTSLGDTVWYDTNANGVQDAGEPGLAGVTVTLADPGPDNILGNGDDGPSVNVITDASGTYSIGNLAINRPYTVSVDTATLPGGLAETYDVDGLGSANTATVTIPDTTGRLDVDFGYRGIGSIGDLVWFDKNTSGTATADAGEPGIPNIPVTVTWAGPDGTFGTADDMVFPTVTDATGHYLVPNLPFGDYTVAVDTTSPAFPAGVVQTYDQDGTGTVNTSSATLSAGTPNVLTQDFSYAGTASLGDRIWLDDNSDGIQDPGEKGIPAVTVTVTYLGADGVAGGGDDIVFTTTTDATGTYLVTGLPAGNYSVTVDPASLPAGVTSTYDLDGKATPNVTAATLAPNENKRDVDFGYNAVAQIGDQIWLDTLGNGDGTFDAGSDYPIPGVAVTVTYLGPDGVAGGGDDIVYNTVTDAQGKYLVTQLPLGNYTVTVTPPAGLTPTFDSNGVGSPNSSAVTLTALAPSNLNQDFSYSGAGSIGDLVWLDRNSSGTATADAGEPGIPGVPVTITWAGADGTLGTADDVVMAKVTDASGNYLVANLPFGPYSVVVDTTATSFPAGVTQTYDADGLGTPNASTTTLSAGTPNVLTQDFSYAGTASIGDRIWLDQNGDGVQDPSEIGIPGVTVLVTYLGADGVAGGGDDIVFTTTTGANGIYLVDGLPAGSYTVAVNPATLPAGLTGTYDLDGIGTANTASATLAAGEAKRDVDFGYTAPGAIGDQVWLDTSANGDGTFDAATDRALPNVAITVTYLGLDGVAGGVDDMVFTTTTAADGTYRIDGLPLGAYTVSANPPVALTQTYDADGIGTGSTSAVSLTAGVPVNLLQDFAYTGTASLGDLVWHDRNADGVQDAGEEGIGGVTVTATWAGPDGVFGTPDDIVLPNQTTAPDGSYLFPNLPAGSYTVVIDPATVPAGYVSTYDLDGSDLTSTTTTLTTGQNRTDVDFGLREIADLMIVKSHPAGGVDPGGSVTFRITVTNLGPGTARAVEVVDTVPDGLTIGTITSPGWTCTTTGQSIVCELTADLPNAGVVFFDVTTTATLAAAPGVMNTVVVTSSTPDLVPTNNTSVDPVQVDAADLSITKKLVGGALYWDKDAEYILTVHNAGPSSVPVGKVVVTDPLPVQLTAISATSADFTCTISGQNVVCTNNAVYTAGTTSTISVKVKVAKVTTAVAVVNQAYVTGGFVDPTPDNDVMGVSITLGTLSSTGSPVTWPVAVGALALLAVGGVLLLVARRRRRTQV